MQKLTWATVRRRVNDLLPYQANPRQISDKQMEDLKKSLKKFNLVELPAIDTDNKIIAGHQRLKALQLLGRGEEEVEVRVPNRKLTKDEFERYLLTSNAVGGDWDFSKLKSFDIGTLLDIGFDESDLAGIWDENLETEGDGFDIDKELAKIKKPKTKLGDLYQLGPHRLICGDSTDSTVLKRHFSKERASIIYSDPVYNIGVDYDRGIGGKQSYGGTVNDKRSPAEYRAFLKKSLEAALSVAKDDAHVFYWNDESQIGLVQALFEEVGLVNRRVCMWIKNGQNPTPGVAFNKCYEPCIYATRGKPYLAKGVDSLNEIFNKEIATGNRAIDDILDLLNIWLVKRMAGQDYQHATAKPPTLHEKAIRRCTRPGDIVLDSFGGSGSTLIAAEQLKRRAFLVELEPAFCDLIIKRYEALTHDKARKLN
ncbi:MAG: DNA modification methylase [Candidatus Pacebacteria bacterium]|nr:DNA modification methylase [Candidatus Paceibacterota bacterium]